MDDSFLLNGMLAEEKAHFDEAKSVISYMPMWESRQGEIDYDFHEFASHSPAKQLPSDFPPAEKNRTGHPQSVAL
jgi:hypothetical protein